MIIFQDHGRRLPSVLLSVIRQDCYAKPFAWTQPSSPDSCTESAVEPFRLEQAMIPQKAAGTLAMLSGEPGSGKTWVALAIAAALTRGRDPFTCEKLKPATVLSASAEHSPPCAAPNSISAFVAPKTENQVPDGGLCPRRRMSTRRSTRQDAQINYLSTLSIFVKQTTYLATLPNPKI